MNAVLPVAGGPISALRRRRTRSLGLRAARPAAGKVTTGQLDRSDRGEGIPRDGAEQRNGRTCPHEVPRRALDAPVASPSPRCYRVTGTPVALPCGPSRPRRRSRPALSCDPARQWTPARALFRVRLRRLPRLAGRGCARGASRGVGVASDAEPRPPDSRPARRRRLAPRALARASAHRRLYSRAAQADRSFLAGPIRRRGPWTRGASPPPTAMSTSIPCGPGSSNGPKPGGGRARVALLGLAEDGLTEFAPARQRFSRFADLMEGEEDAAATARLSQGRNHRPADQLGKLPCGARSQDRSPAPGAQARTQAKGRPSGWDGEIGCPHRPCRYDGR